MKVRITKWVLSKRELDKIRKQKGTIDLRGKSNLEKRLEARKSKKELWLHIKLLIGAVILVLLIMFQYKVYWDIETTPKQEIDPLEQVLQDNPEIKQYIEPKVKQVAEVRARIHKTDKEVIQEAKKFLKKYEWFRTLAYYDHKQWSICYWTKSYKWEIVSKENCENRLEARIKTELLRINRLADNLAWNKKVALISFMYNTWYNYKILNYARRWDDKSVVFLVSQYNSASWKYLKGLQKRRNAEIDYYLNK